MSNRKLSKLMQDAPRGNPALDADVLVRLANGEHLGARHDEIVAQLAGSATDAALLQLAQELAPAAQELALGLAAERDSKVVALPLRRRMVAQAWPWALAAGLAGVAIVAGVERTRLTSIATPVVEQPAGANTSVLGSDQILAGSFEEGATSVPGATGSDDIFVDEFGDS